MQDQRIQLCECGCGQPAPRATRTYAGRGVFKGQPQRFIAGHYARLTLEERLWPKVDKRGPDECWEWLASRDKDGYGQFSVRHGDGWKGCRAHRVVYELLAGPIPDGLQLDHLCRNPPCVNPAHLEAVTCQENLLRGKTLNAAAIAKTHCPQGHPYAGDNLYVNPKGERSCRECARAACRKWWRKNRAA